MIALPWIVFLAAIVYMVWRGMKDKRRNRERHGNRVCLAGGTACRGAEAARPVQGRASEARSAGGAGAAEVLSVRKAAAAVVGRSGVPGVCCRRVSGVENPPVEQL